MFSWFIADVSREANIYELNKTTHLFVYSTTGIKTWILFALIAQY